MIGVQQGAPKWITKVHVLLIHATDLQLFHLPPTAFVREIVFVDPSTTTATAMSVNLSLAQYISCLELCTYSPNGSSTFFRQRAMLVSAFPTAYIARKIEGAGLQRFKDNAGVGKRGFDWVLSHNGVIE